MVVADAEIVALANALAKLLFWAEFDAEATLAAFREKHGAKTAELSQDGLKELFMGLGYDKLLTPEPAEGEGEGEGEAADEEEAAEEAEKEEGEDAPAAEDGETQPASEEGAEAGAAEGEGSAAAGPAGEPAAPPAAPETSKNYEAVFALLDTDGKGSIEAARSIGLMALCKSGFGEGAFRFALKAVDAEGSGNIKEDQLWTAISLAANQPLDATIRAHLRKAWRTAEKAAPPEPEEPAEGEEGEAAAEEEAAEGGEEGEKPEGEGEDGEGSAAASSEPAAPPAPPGPEDTKVIVESFMEQVTGDDRLSSVLLAEVPIPIEEPPAPEGEEEAEEE